ncbi:hypothetical protein ESCO_004284 [Escovopsis weberi]|uniref:F-box domain-containing protein n=1 Tax=Escovopsis weberi TaxID=150374 RepID=A0A0M9VVK4_ESCWE|nr:hypothetical protein ESCO_004284 [Escovopsis weberi]
MADNRRAAAIGPSHLTEFASPRFHEKIQQPHPQNNASSHPPPHAQHGGLSASGSASALTAAAAVASEFILPLRASKAVDLLDSNKRDKGFFNHFRHRVSLRHSKHEADYHLTPPSKTSIEPSERKMYTLPGAPPAVRRTHADTPHSLPLDQLFLSLPNELQIQIISLLPLTDVLNLRLTSKSWHALITFNEAPIVRYHLEHHIPAYALRLYPIRDAAEINFHFLCSLWHRLHVAAKLAFLMCEWITKDIFLRQTEAQRVAFAPQTERMRRRLIPLLFVIFHFFETYRKLSLQRLSENGGIGLSKEPFTKNPIEVQIMNMYDNQTLLRVHEVFPLVISSFCRRLRPPTYVGRVERSLRGYLRERPPDEVHAAILCLGGLRQVERLWEIKGYNNRRNAVDTWIASLSKEKDPLFDAPNPSKGRLGLIGFGRKRSSSGDRPRRTSIGESRKGPRGSIDAAPSCGWDVFNTSLAADAPMAPLERDQTQALLGDLPVLQHIWLMTAEAMILERKVVHRPSDIKRNQQVMLDLIREDGMVKEDEWWYGRGIPDSIRPPAGAVYDDAD